jgi:hypothetical protein
MHHHPSIARHGSRRQLDRPRPPPPLPPETDPSIPYHARFYYLTILNCVSVFFSRGALTV